MVVEAPPEAAPPAAQDVQAQKFEMLVSAAKLFGLALSARALLMLSLCGAFVLGVYAMSKGTGMALAVLVAYGLLTVAPVAWLEIKRRG